MEACLPKSRRSRATTDVEVVPILFGFGCLAALVGAIHIANVYRIWFAVLLCASYAASNVAWQMDMLAYLPILDLLIGIAAIDLHAVCRARWTLWLLLLAGTQLILHVSHSIYGYTEAYLMALDVTFAAQLWVVGGGNLGVVHLLGRVRDRRRPVRSTSSKAMTDGG